MKGFTLDVEEATFLPILILSSLELAGISIRDSCSPTLGLSKLILNWLPRGEMLSNYYAKELANRITLITKGKGTME